MLRKVEPMRMPDIVPAELRCATPKTRMVDPRELLVDESYQRNLSERSVSLIRRIVAEWDWRAFKPPSCVEVEGALHVTDGQHTAIAAASHPAISRIPVIVTEDGIKADRAMAFVRQNRDRIAVTPTQMHFSLVAAAEETALTVDQVCKRAGARILKFPPPYGKYKPGDTMAIQTLRSLVSKRYAKGAREIVQICVEGQMAPVTANALKAVEALMHEEQYSGLHTPESLVLAIREMDFEWEREGKRKAAEHELLLWRAMMIVLHQKARKGKRANGRSAA